VANRNRPGEGLGGFFLQLKRCCRVDVSAMKPTTLLSCLFALALTSAVSAEEPGRPPEGGRGPERREEGDRDNPRERGPETETRKAEPVREGEMRGPARDEGKRPEGRPHDEGKSRGPHGPGDERHMGKGPDHKGPPDGKKPPHDGAAHGSVQHKGPDAHKGHGGDMPKGRGDAPHRGPEKMKGREEWRGHSEGPQVNHVREAIRHLHAAGMHEVAGLLEAKAKSPAHGAMGMRHSHMMKPPFAKSGPQGPGAHGHPMHRGPRPEGERKPGSRPERG
jgi:hypothetical protein